MRLRILLVIVMGLLASSTRAQDTAQLGVGVGIFDTAAWFDDKGDYDAVEAGVVLRGLTNLPWGIGPMAGVSATDEGAWWVYLGVRRPIRVGRGWDFGPTLAVSYYEQGDGKNLGHELEFRSGLEINHTRASGSSLGIEFYHLSNASISDVNPGSNSLWMVYSIPLGR